MVRTEAVQISDLESHYFLTIIRRMGARDVVRLGTLGPSGTSSEYVARLVLDSLTENKKYDLVLETTFESCISKLLNDELDFVLVPHAYLGINDFYMNPRLEPAMIFRADTPRYGLATRKDYPFEPDMLQREVIVSHPAPVPLIKHYLGEDVQITLVNSTSEAALRVKNGEFNVAITNEEAVHQYGLKFVKQFAPIPMTWTIFSKSLDRSDIQ